MRGVPNTKQGIYAVSPSGVFLASTNTIDADPMADMLRKALDKWKTLSKQERLLSEDPSQAKLDRSENRYPKDGLALKVVSRDMPRTGVPNDWRANAWNIDYAWFRKEEMASMLPKDWSKGASVAWPEALAKRLVRFHLLDNVRGQTDAYEDKDVVEAALKTEVTKVAKGVVTLRFEGSTKASTTSKWPGADPDPQTRGLGTRILGSATYDPQKGRFTAFELVAVGTRWGASRFNFREDDRKVAPIGFVLSMAADKPAERVPPAFIFSYGWQP